MPVTWTEIEEGDLVSAADMNARFLGVVAEINDLDEEAVERRSLHAAHLPSPIIESGIAFIDDGTTHTYDNTNEPYPGWDTAAGWTLINDGGGQSLLVTGLAADMTNADLYGILVMVNVHVLRMVQTGGVASANNFVIVAIQARDTGTTWHHIPRTERYIDADGDAVPTPAILVDEYKDIPIRTVIRQADVGDVTIDQIRVVISLIAAPVAAVTTATLREGRLTITSLHAGTLV